MTALEGSPPKLLNPYPVLNVPITPELVQKHGLLPMEYEAIQNVLGRQILT